jgi:hypothetical protein
MHREEEIRLFSGGGVDPEGFDVSVRRLHIGVQLTIQGVRRHPE